jgi:hypothetical protein
MEQLELNFVTCTICNGHPCLDYDSSTGVYTFYTCPCSSFEEEEKEEKEEEEECDWVNGHKYDFVNGEEE